MHTVGISIGSADGIDRAHLTRLRTLVDRLDPVLVSGHLAWSALGGTYLNDLLPLPYTDETLRVVVEHLAEVQDVLGRAYVDREPVHLPLARHVDDDRARVPARAGGRTGCRLLCDVSNIHLSGHNMGYDPYRFIDEFPAAAVAELHLGGFTPEEDEATPGETLLVDTHAEAVADPVWDLYAHAIRRFGPQPTIVEWDNDLPPWPSCSKKRPRPIACARPRERSGMPALADIQAGIRDALVQRRQHGRRARPAGRRSPGTPARDSPAPLRRESDTALLDRFPATVWLVGSDLVTARRDAPSFASIRPSRRASPNTAKTFPRTSARIRRRRRCPTLRSSPNSSGIWDVWRSPPRTRRTCTPSTCTGRSTS